MAVASFVRLNDMEKVSRIGKGLRGTRDVTGCVIVANIQQAETELQQMLQS